MLPNTESFHMPTLSTPRVSFAGLILLATIGCGGRTQVARIDPGEAVDLSGFWNDSDEAVPTVVEGS